MGRKLCIVLRYHIVICLIAIAGLLAGLNFGAGYVPEEPIAKFYTEFTDCDFAKELSVRTKEYNISQVDSNDMQSADLYITTSEKVPSGFSSDSFINIGKISPVVYVSDDIDIELDKGIEAGNVTRADNIHGLSIYTINLKSALEEYAKASKEVGVRGDRIFGITDQKYYKLMLPDTNSEYRKMAVDTIIVSLLNGESATEDKLEAIKPTVEAVLKNSYTSYDLKNSIKKSSDSFLIIGPESWVGDIFALTYANKLYIENCNSTWIKCYYKDGKENLASTLFQSFKSTEGLNRESGYTSTCIREPGMAMSDQGSVWGGAWEVCKDYVQEAPLDSKSVESVFGKQYYLTDGGD